MIPRSTASFVFASLVLCLLVAAGCDSAQRVDRQAGTIDVEPPPAVPGQAPLPSARFGAEPVIRVRIERKSRGVTLDSPSGIVIVGPGPGVRSTVQPRTVHTPVTVTLTGGRFVVRPTRGSASAWSMPGLMFAPGSTNAAAVDQISVDGSAYPQRIALEAVASAVNDRFDVINHVHMERYLPGVLQGELYASWSPATFEAAAIAARSYAIWEMDLSRRKGKSYDVEATVASQVYTGHKAGSKPVSAVVKTRGQVLAYQGRIVPAFYSSTCGGRSQNAHSAIPAAPDIEPLHAHVHREWCAGTKHYRWGPVQRSTTELVRRINAWAAQDRHDLAALPSLSRVTFTHATPQGRPTRVELVDHTGRRYAMAAEDLRHAANYPAPGYDKPTGNALVRSSDSRITIVGDTVTFSSGRGFGHGAGLCQWGAQNMALAGHDARAILATYYQGARIVQGY